MDSFFDAGYRDALQFCVHGQMERIATDCDC